MRILLLSYKKADRATGPGLIHGELEKKLRVKKMKVYDVFLTGWKSVVTKESQELIFKLVSLLPDKS